MIQAALLLLLCFRKLLFLGFQFRQRGIRLSVPDCTALFIEYLVLLVSTRNA
ncbi:MAG: hypothetical protein ACXW3G_14735 [Rhodoplanes sp.]|jgi:hypothetical protein